MNNKFSQTRRRLEVREIKQYSKKMKIILFSIILSCLFINISSSEDYKMSDIEPKDLVNDGYTLHTVTPIPDEGPRVMLYTFINNKKKKVVSCIVDLFDMSADLHICYNVTQ